MGTNVAHLPFADVEHSGKFCGGYAFFAQFAHSLYVLAGHFGSRVGVVYASAVLVDLDGCGLDYAHFYNNNAASNPLQ